VDYICLFASTASKHKLKQQDEYIGKARPQRLLLSGSRCREAGRTKYRSTALSCAVCCPAVSLQMRISRPKLGLHNRPGHHFVQAYSFLPAIRPLSGTICFVQSGRVCTLQASSSSHGRMSDRPPSPSHFRHQPSCCRCLLLTLLRHVRGQANLETYGRACAAFMPCSTLSSAAFCRHLTAFLLSSRPGRSHTGEEAGSPQILFLSHMLSRANNGTS
jgi:hypothetical protein